MTTTSTPLPHEWHRSPKGVKPCPVCGCPAPRGEHRASTPAEHLEIRWLGRAKGPSGWKFHMVGAGKEVNPFELVRMLDDEMGSPHPQPMPSDPQTVPDRLGDYYLQLFEPLKLRSRAANTKRLYRTTVVNFTRFLGRAALLADLNDQTVNRFLQSFLQKGRSPYSVNKERSNLLAIWRYAAAQRHVETWPNVEAEVQPRRLPQSWTIPEIERLLVACGEHSGQYYGIPAGLWWTTLHLVMWDSAERIGALLHVRWDDVDLNNNWFVVKAEYRKGGKADRGYRLHPSTTEALRKIRAKNQKVFPWPQSSTYLWRIYKLILAAAGLPTDSKSKFHRMRRSVASHVEAAGGNATKLLDHSHRCLTERSYLDQRLIPQEHITDLLPPLGPQVEGGAL